MAHTKHGIFKELKNEERRLDKEYKKILDAYVGPAEDEEFFSGLAYSSDSLYVDLTHFINNVHGMLKSTELEMEEKENDYKEMERVAIEHRNEIQSLFQYRVEEIKSSGGYLTPAEEETLKKLTIR